ncbi:MAG: hypothetical protein Q8914_02025 [Bacteroidota bacterium]|nr:hypothetical protein [Bacteroidota bacterium]
MSSSLKQRKSTVTSYRSRNKYRIQSRIQFVFRAGHHNGHGIHSPYLYHLITNILNNDYPYYCFDTIETALKSRPASHHPSLLEQGKHLFGKHLPFTLSTETRIANSRILFRLAHDMKADYIVETCFCGYPDSAYLVKARPNAHFLCLNTSQEQTNAAKELFQLLDISSVDCRTSPGGCDFKRTLEGFPRIDLVLFNPLNDKQLLLDLFQRCLEKKQASSIFVFKNIHHSKNMEAVWKLVKANPEVSVSIDIFSMGILLFRPDLEKRAYIIRK